MIVEFAKVQRESVPTALLGAVAALILREFFRQFAVRHELRPRSRSVTASFS